MGGLDSRKQVNHSSFSICVDHDCLLLRWYLQQMSLDPFFSKLAVEIIESE